MDDQVTGKARGAKKLAEMMTPEERKERAKKAATARWGTKVTHKGSFMEHFGIDVDCYVLDDQQKTAVISKRGMAQAMGFSKRGDRLVGFVNSKNMEDYIGRELRQKIENPIIFQRQHAAAGNPISDEAHGYDATILVDICNAIVSAKKDGKLTGSRYDKMAEQAQIILSASAKSGIKHLVYSLSGYNPTAQEVIEAFKLYIQEEAKKYEKEFPTELYIEWQRLYNITPPQRGKNWKEMHLTVDHIYYPLAKSNGKLLELLRIAKTSGEDRGKKLFQFLNEVGTRALRMQLGRVLEMAESSPDKRTYEAKIILRFGGQLSLDIPTYPIS